MATTTSYVITVGTIPDGALRRHHRASGTIYVGTHQAVRVRGAHRPSAQRPSSRLHRASGSAHPAAHRGRHRAVHARTTAGRPLLTAMVIALISVVVIGAWLSAPDAVAFASIVQP